MFSTSELVLLGLLLPLQVGEEGISSELALWITRPFILHLKANSANSIFTGIFSASSWSFRGGWLLNGVTISWENFHQQSLWFAAPELAQGTFLGSLYFPLSSPFFPSTLTVQIDFDRTNFAS